MVTKRPEKSERYEQFLEWLDERPEKSERSERLWERSVDQKERLVQTYTVLYGLLISFGQDKLFQTAQSDAVKWFFPFLILILIYYMLLSRTQCQNPVMDVK